MGDLSDVLVDGGAVACPCCDDMGRDFQCGRPCVVCGGTTVVTRDSLLDLLDVAYTALDDERPNVECPGCDGSGDDVRHEGTCTLCGGTGQLNHARLLDDIAGEIDRLRLEKERLRWVVRMVVAHMGPWTEEDRAVVRAVLGGDGATEDEFDAALAGRVPVTIVDHVPTNTCERAEEGARGAL